MHGSARGAHLKIERKSLICIAAEGHAVAVDTQRIFLGQQLLCLLSCFTCPLCPCLLQIKLELLSCRAFIRLISSGHGLQWSQAMLPLKRLEKRLHPPAVRLPEVFGATGVGTNAVFS